VIHRRTLRSLLPTPLLLLAAATLTAQEGPVESRRQEHPFPFVVRHDPGQIRLAAPLLGPLLERNHAGVLKATGASARTPALRDVEPQPPGTYAGIMVLQFDAAVDMATAEKVARAHLDRLREDLEEKLVVEARRDLQARLDPIVNDLQQVATRLERSDDDPAATAATLRVELGDLRIQLRVAEMEYQSAEAASKVIHAEQQRLERQLNLTEQQRAKVRTEIQESEFQIAQIGPAESEPQQRRLQKVLRGLERHRLELESLVAELENLRGQLQFHEQRLAEHTLQMPVQEERIALLVKEIERREHELKLADVDERRQSKREAHYADLRARQEALRQLSQQLQSELRALEPVRVQAWW